MMMQIFLAPVLYFIVADLDRLTVEADPAVAAIPRLLDGRQLIRLPELVFPLRIDAHCGRGGEVQTVSISVADTRKTIAGDELSTRGPLHTSVTVSPRQIAPLALQQFCDADAAKGQTLLLATALTAQVSLRCTRDDEQSILFDARPLDIRLVCEAGDDQGNDGAIAQLSSGRSVSRRNASVFAHASSAYSAL